MIWNNVTVKLGDLQPWEHNPRTMTKRQAQRLLKSWRDLGQFQTIAIGPRQNGSGHPVYDGHQRLNALLAAYGAQYEIEARQCERELSEDERRYLITQANLPVGAWRFEEIAGWPEAQDWGFDAEMLATWNADGAALATMLEAENGGAGDADADPQIDRAAELNEKWQVKTGDLWCIGEHRLLCGDSTKREDVERVMQGERAKLLQTDPPYNLGDAWNGLQKLRGNEQVENDNRSDWSDWFNGALSVWLEYALDTNSSGYIWFTEMSTPRPIIENMGLSVHATIIWVKEHYNVGRADYHAQHEPCIYFSRGKRYWCGRRDVSDIWKANRIEQERVHPTQKPLSLIEFSISNSSERDYIVSDFFAGSGTTIVACQNLQRKCRAIEISPNYCAVILERMATAFPGIEIERLEHGTS